MGRKSLWQVDRDIDRAARNLIANKGRFIGDEQTFLKQYNSYFEPSVNPSFKHSKNKEAVWKRVKELKSIPDEKLFKEARGKNFAKDRKHTSKHIVLTPQEYIRRGANKVDLAGYDTRPQFDFIGKSRGRVKYSRPDNVKGKLVFRDKKGRFVAVNRKRLMKKYNISTGGKTKNDR